MKKRMTMGVVVGRFHVAALHTGHLYLLNYAERENDRLLILVGVHGGLGTNNNPLDYPVRRAMLAGIHPHAEIAPIEDQPTDAGWSAAVDAMIARYQGDAQVRLYGSRDSFLPSYSGVHETVFVDPIKSISGTDVRKQLAGSVVDHPHFRAGLIHYHNNREPIAYPVVDVAVVDRERSRILLGAKARDGHKRRFIGGFVHPDDPSLEHAAKREMREEVGAIEVADLQYLGSRHVDDHRYRGSRDGIVSSFFAATYVFGAPRAADDLDHVEWRELREMSAVLVPEHQPLGEMLAIHMN